MNDNDANLPPDSNPMRKRQPRFDRLEVTLIVVLALILGAVVGSRLFSNPGSADPLAGRAITNELAPFVAKYGPRKYSSHEEEFFIRDFFHDKRGGTFVDVGASHYRDRSNTYYLERELGWSGIAVDALARFGPGYVKYRPRTKFFALFVSDISDAKATLYVGSNDLFSSSERRFTEDWVDVANKEEIPTITLDDLLATQGVTSFDFLSMDIELSEPKALAGFDIQRFEPALVGIEAHPQVRQQLLDYFHRNGYVIVGKYLRADPQNLWFAPADADLRR